MAKWSEVPRQSWWHQWDQAEHQANGTFYQRNRRNGGNLTLWESTENKGGTTTLWGWLALPSVWMEKLTSNYPTWLLKKRHPQSQWLGVLWVSTFEEHISFVVQSWHLLNLVDYSFYVLAKNHSLQLYHFISSIFLSGIHTYIDNFGLFCWLSSQQLPYRPWYGESSAGQCQLTGKAQRLARNLLYHFLAFSSEGHDPNSYLRQTVRRHGT